MDSFEISDCEIRGLLRSIEADADFGNWNESISGAFKLFCLLLKRKSGVKYVQKDHPGKGLGIWIQDESITTEKISNESIDLDRFLHEKFDELTKGGK